jgi:hypothetical protein
MLANVVISLDAIKAIEHDFPRFVAAKLAQPTDTSGLGTLTTEQIATLARWAGQCAGQHIGKALDTACDRMVPKKIVGETP